jgi:thiamine-monophosphate kinase
MGRPSEDELIRTYFAPLAGEGAFGLGDDAARISGKPGRDLVVTADMVIGGVHFFGADPPGAIARKALRVNLSDLAAKGAEPVGFLLTLGLPEDWSEPWLAGFALGLGDDAAAYNCPLLGGDTVKSPGATAISITAFGAVSAGSMVMRAGVKPGDRIYVSGTIGDAALGLKIRKREAADAVWVESLSQDESAFLAGRYLLPQPRLGLHAALRGHAHAAIDISDGFAGDLAKLLALTGMTAEVAASNVPFSQAAQSALRSWPAVVEALLTGGDDYEILCAVPPARCAAFEAEAAAAGVLIAPVAVAVPGDGPPVFWDESGKALVFPQPSFQHFLKGDNAL